MLFVSAAGVQAMAATPLGAAKIATEEALAGSTLREVVLRPDQFQEVWLAPTAQFDWPTRKVVIFGTGETPVRYVAIDDVAASAVALALSDDPARLVEFGGAEALTRTQAVEVFERVLESRSAGARFRGWRCGRRGRAGVRPVRHRLAMRTVQIKG